MNNDVVVLKDTNIQGKKLSINVSNNLGKPLMIACLPLLSTNEEVFVLGVTPNMARRIIAGLEHLNEWYETDYCKWAKRRTKGA